jgi:hypothetical protein
VYWRAGLIFGAAPAYEKMRLVGHTIPGATWFRRGHRSSAGHAEDQITS